MRQGFSAKISSFGTNTLARVNRIKKAVCLELFGAVIKDTPVLSGRLRGNWNCNLDQPALTVDETIKGKSSAPTIAKMMTAVGPSKLEQDVYLSNSLPYATRIEFDGWSHTKAPEGMVRRNVVRFNKLIEKEAKK